MIFTGGTAIPSVYRERHHLGTIAMPTSGKITSPDQTLYIEGTPAPTEAIGMKEFKASQSCVVSAGAEAVVMVDSA